MSQQQQQQTFAPTAGALGTEVKSRKRALSTAATSGSTDKRKRLPGGIKQLADSPNAPTKDQIPPIYDDAPLIKPTNIAGSPDLLLRSEMGVKSMVTKTANCENPGSLNTESYIHFIVKSHKSEFIHFREDSVSLVIFCTYNNPNKLAAGTDEQKATVHALRARDGLPNIWLDPTIMATGMVQRCEVSVNNVPAPTNGAVHQYLPQYVRCNRIYRKNAEVRITREGQVDLTKHGEAMREPMRSATSPFDYAKWNATHGTRVPIYLDGMFPFSFKNGSLQSIDNVKEKNYYFPPDTEIDIKLHLTRSRSESFFHPDLQTMDAYFDGTQQIGLTDRGMKFTIQSAVLEYDSVELHPNNHIETMNLFTRGYDAEYFFDIPRGLNQALAPNVSYTENNFQIMPYARLVYILFLPDWASNIMEATKRPISGFSRFPAKTSSIKIYSSSAGPNPLITSNFERFGFAGERHQISKKIFYDYLVQKRLTSDKFSDFFPRSSTESSYVQAFVIDLRNSVSAKNETLTVRCEFAGGDLSPKNTQIVVLSVHPNGRASCSLNKNAFNYFWQFSHSA